MIDEVLGKLGFDWKVALANLVNFLIIYYLLRNVVFKKLGTAIKTRQEKIQQGLDDADKAKSALVEASSRKDELLREAYKDSQDIIGNAKEERNKIIGSASDDAEKEAAKIRQGAHDQADMILKKADEDLTEKAANLVVEGMEKVLKESMTKDINEKYVTSLLK
jgi:F-type H+-transporting ATPase subunit b